MLPPEVGRGPNHLPRAPMRVRGIVLIHEIMVDRERVEVRDASPRIPLKKIERKRNNKSIWLPTLSAVLHVVILSKLVGVIRHCCPCANAHGKRTLPGSTDTKEYTHNLRYQQRLARV